MLSQLSASSFSTVVESERTMSAHRAADLVAELQHDRHQQLVLGADDPVDGPGAQSCGRRDVADRRHLVAAAAELRTGHRAHVRDLEVGVVLGVDPALDDVLRDGECIRSVQVRIGGGVGGEALQRDPALQRGQLIGRRHRAGSRRDRREACSGTDGRPGWAGRRRSGCHRSSGRRASVCSIAAWIFVGWRRVNSMSSGSLLGPS